MSDTKDRKAEPQPKVKDLLSGFEKGNLQNGTAKVDSEKPVAIPGGTRKLTAAYEKINEPAAPPELQRVKSKPQEEDAPVENDVKPEATSAEPVENAATPEVTSTSSDSVEAPVKEAEISVKEVEAPVASDAPPQPATTSQEEVAAPVAPSTPSKGNVLIVFADPERKGFNGAILDAAVAELTNGGYNAVVSDLYRMGFDPLPSRKDAGETGDSSSFNYNIAMANAFANKKLSQDIAAEQEKIDAAKLVVFIASFGISGFSPMLQGYLNRVLSSGFVGDMNKMEMFDNGRMKGKKAVICFNTEVCGSSFSRRSLFGDIEVFLWPIQNGALRFAGFEVLTPQISYNVGTGNDDDDQANVGAWASRLSSISQEEGLEFQPLSRFDANDHLQMSKKDADETDVGFSIGQNLGKGFPPGGMLGGMDEVDAGGSYDINN